MTATACVVEYCSSPGRSRGMCSKHYDRWRVHGVVGFEPRTVIERFWASFDRGERGCWVWKGEIVHNGYGRFSVDGGRHLAHRFAYELLVGPIPSGLEIDHLCRNRACINPAHLEPVTGLENRRRSGWVQAVNATKTHCKHGHPFDEGNTRRYLKNGREVRSCRACAREASRLRRERMAA